MEGYELKKLSDVELSASAEGAKVLIEQDGEIKRVDKDQVGAPDAVQSVNGAKPDENGNVEVEVPEGFSGSWNDLADRPFCEDKTVITWDGDATGRVVSDVWLDSASPTFRFVKVSEETFTVDFIKTFSVKLVAKVAGESVVMPVEGVYTEDTGVAVASLSEGPVGFVVCYESESIYTVSGHEAHRFPETGVYFATILDSGEELGYASQIESSAIKQLDPKFIPSSVGIELPTVTTGDVGKFLRVSADGKWVAESIANAEEASF